MKLNDKIHGFKITDIRDIPDVGGRMYMMCHEVSGARLCFLSRADECKTFAVSFKTTPTDDTGVFHILEHSVLGGSRKFKTKEPFTDLLRTSLNAFLNAMTYPDRTTYPVSSKNNKDFHNLVDVYMDAVFYPRATSDKNIFLQEGWRYESDDEGKLSYNGVVYSEMRGAYASPEELLSYYSNKMLFPGGTYSYSAGGEPSAITTLTYEDFCLAHRKFYSPENAFFYLDGEVDLGDILPLLSSYLDEIESGDFIPEITFGDGIITEPFLAEYELEADAESKDKNYLALSYIVGEGKDDFLGNTLNAVFDAIADTNSAPLKRAVLDLGLCTDFNVYTGFSSTYATLTFEFAEVKDGKEEELIATFDREIAKIIECGIDEEMICASIDLSEFREREADFGSTPRGIVYLSPILDYVNFGLHPADALDFTKEFKELRDALGTKHYVDTLARAISGKRATVILRPNSKLAEENEMKIRKKLDTVAGQMTNLEKLALKEEGEKFNIWQQTPDTIEALLTIPTLTLSDLGEGPKEIPTEEVKGYDFPVIVHKMNTNGIVYTDIFFDASDTKEEDLPTLALMTSLFSGMDTEEHDANELVKITRSTAGGMTLAAKPALKCGENRLYLAFSFSALVRKYASVLELAKEVLYKKNYNNPERVRRKIAQRLHAAETALQEGGSAFAVARCAAKLSSADAIRQYTTIIGYEYIKFLKKYNTATDEEIGELVEKMAALYKKVLVAERMTLAITADSPFEFIESTADVVKHGSPCEMALSLSAIPTLNEGIAISAAVGSAALATNLRLCPGEENNGVYTTLMNILSHRVLWEEIRVKGGAYGANFSVRTNSGLVTYYSYRDPSPARSLDIYLKSHELVRRVISESEDITGYIIGAAGSGFMQATTPAQESSAANDRYLAGKSHEDIVALWHNLIGTTKEELLSSIAHLEEILKSSAATIVAPRRTLIDMGIKNILEI